MGLCKMIVSLPRGKSTIEGIGIVFFQKIQDKVYRHWFLDSLINSLSGGEWRIRIPQKPRQKTEAQEATIWVFQPHDKETWISISIIPVETHYEWPWSYTIRSLDIQNS